MNMNLLKNKKIWNKKLIRFSHTEVFLVRNDWKKSEIQEIYDMPLLDLVNKASNIHRMFFNSREVQQCTLLSIKTGGCVEDCKYCSQSAAHKTFVKPTPTMKVSEVVEIARRAKDAGSTRFCMGAAWRDVGETKDRKAFSAVLEMVKQVIIKYYYYISI